MSDNAGNAPDPVGGSIPPADGSASGSNSGAGNAPSRKRGRPAGSRNRDAGSPVERIDPAALGDGNSAGSSDAPAARKRGRPARAKEEPISLDTLVTALSVAQLSLVSATGIPEFMLAEPQTKALAEATQKVTRHFPSVLTQKQQDIVGLISCMGAIAFTQTRAYQARKAAEHAAKSGGNVSAFPMQ